MWIRKGPIESAALSPGTRTLPACVFPAGAGSIEASLDETFGIGRGAWAHRPISGGDGE